MKPEDKQWAERQTILNMLSRKPKTWNRSTKRYLIQKGVVVRKYRGRGRSVLLLTHKGTQFKKEAIIQRHDL